MKAGTWFVAALVTLSTIPVMAQQAGAGAAAQQGASATAGKTAATESAAAGAAGSANLRPVSGELANKLDSKSAKVGDQVIVKTTEAARMADGAVIPKGSRIIGHVTNVQAHGSGQQDSHIAVQFDRAELKNGQSMAIHSVIASVSPSQTALAAAANGNTADDAQFAGAGMPAGRAGGGAVGAGRGGLGGALGAAGGVAGGAANTAVSVGANAGSTLGGVGNTVGAAGSAAGGATANLGGASAELSNAASAGVHATAVPGVMLAGDASGATSGTLSASRRNVHLDGGTQLVLGVAVSANQQ